MVTITSCGDLGYMLGGHNVLGSGAYLQKTYDMSSFSQQGTVHVELEFFHIDI